MQQYVGPIKSTNQVVEGGRLDLLKQQEVIKVDE